MPYYPAFVDTYAREKWSAPDRGLLAQNMPVESALTGIIMPTAGQVRVIRVRLPKTSSVTNIVMYCSTAGNTLTSGQCFAGLYTGAGVKIGITATQHTAWASAGLQTMAIVGGPYACVAGEYSVAFWYNGTTAPTFFGVSGTAAALNVGRSSPSFFYASADTSITTTAPDPLGAQSTSGAAWWVGLS